MNKFKLKPEDIKELIPSMGYCLASDKITVEGLKVGFMYREEPEEADDSGWRFLSVTETQEYIDNDKNIMIFDVNTIANYDPAIIAYIKMYVGTELERIEGTEEFREIKV